jgi:hypothetical protein
MLTYMRFGYCAVLLLSACYAPSVIGGAPCDPSQNSCPTGQACVAANGGNFCSTEGATLVDAGGGGTGDGSDSGTVKDPNCFGSGLLGSVCLQRAPTAPVSLATTTINTASVGAGNCSEIRAQTGGPSLCIVAGTTIQIAAGATVRALGANPLVLIASQSITITGGLDVSSRAGDVGGAGARTAAECAATGIDGVLGKLLNNNFYGGGGAAGGGAGGAGGNGGRGNIGHGNPVATVAPARVLVGGCPGGRGGDGIGGGGGGTGGNGGGAIYLIAGDSIAIAGKINASGAGGGAGTAGVDSSGGGGGGGAGGMIGLEALRLTVAGSLYANGGGGGGGGGGSPTDRGQPGTDPTTATAVAPGGSGGNGGGGNGGNGSVAAQPGTAGQASTNFNETGGGGGGGGGGAIRVFGVPASQVTGAVSPPAT